jgi:hypothetical protein
MHTVTILRLASLSVTIPPTVYVGVRLLQAWKLRRAMQRDGFLEELGRISSARSLSNKLALFLLSGMQLITTMVSLCVPVTVMWNAGGFLQHAAWLLGLSKNIASGLIIFWHCRQDDKAREKVRQLTEHAQKSDKAQKLIISAADLPVNVLLPHQV